MRARGFTMIEVAAVAGAAAAVAAIAIVGITAALDSSRRESRMQAVLEDLVRRRAAHLALASPAESCLVVRLSQSVPRTLEFEERADCKDASTARPVERKSYDVVSLTLVEVGGAQQFCVDNLARVRVCSESDPMVFRDQRIEIDADRTLGTDGTLTWSQGGRISATFASGIDASAQPHLSDVGSTSTPQPTQQGGYQGLATDPRGLLE
jgi:type II secretory pathway pseudopilin PulG